MRRKAIIFGIQRMQRKSGHVEEAALLQVFFFPSQIYNLLYSGVISKCVVG
jgi:hypothetical protein